MRALPPAHVRRPRLIEALAASRVGLVAAPGGFGKSVLAAELAAHLDVPAVESDLAAPVAAPSLLAAALRRGAARAGLSDLAAELGKVADDDPAAAASAIADAVEAAHRAPLLVVDEAQLLDGAAVDVVAALVRDPPGDARVLVLGRTIAGRIGTAAGDGAARLGAEQLVFERGEVAAVLAAALGEEAGAAEEAAVFAAGQGWPALTSLAAARLAREPAATRAHLSSARRTLTALVDDALAGLDPAARGLAAQLAHLPFVSPALVDAVAGAGAFEQLVRAGLPLAPRDDGWHELPGRVREELAGRGRLDPDTARRAAETYARGGELPTALELLARAGVHDDLAALLADRSLAELAEVGLPVLLATVATVPDAVLRTRPRALLQVVRIADQARRAPARRELLARAGGLEGLDDATVREFDAERAVDAYARRDYDRMEELVASVLDRAAPTEIVARGRALVARAVLASEREDASGAAALEEAAALFGAAGETRWRGEALGMLAFRFRFHAGELEAAARTMAEALACLPGPSSDRTSWLTFRAEIATYAGDLAEADAALREAEATGRALGDRRSLAYAAWVGAQLATVRRDAAVATQRFLLAEQQGGYEPGSGLLLVVEAACSLIRLDERAAGLAYLERAETQAAALGFEVVALLPRGLYESRYGDPARAEEALAAYQQHQQQQMAPRDEWRILLERAWAARRRGDQRAATTLAARAFEAARARGLDDLPALHEPDLVAELAPLATAAGSDAARAVEEREPTLGVVTLGGFEVTADGRPLDLPPGRTATLVKLLALARDPVPLDVAIEELWPDSDAATGRRRLRNVLNRIRAACGELVVRTDAETLALGERVEVDMRLFLREAVEALAADGVRREALARTAVGRYGGELLPGDRYAAWAAAPREELRRRLLDLLDLLADEARERGELDEAIRLLDQGIAIEPFDEARYLACAELLLMQRRRGSARSLVDRAVELRDSLRLPPSPRLDRLVAATRPAAVEPA